MLHLKNRISMMNKKRSRSIGKTKYLIFIPVVGVLLILSNVDASARITDELTESTFADVLLPEAILPFPFAGDASPLKSVRSMCYLRKGSRLSNVPVTRSLPLWR